MDYFETLKNKTSAIGRSYNSGRPFLFPIFWGLADWQIANNYIRNS